MFFFSQIDVQFITYSMFANSIPSHSKNFALVFVLEMLMLIIQICTDQSGHGALLIVTAEIRLTLL